MFLGFAMCFDVLRVHFAISGWRNCILGVYLWSLGAFYIFKRWNLHLGPYRHFSGGSHRVFCVFGVHFAISSCGIRIFGVHMWFWVPSVMDVPFLMPHAVLVVSKCVLCGFGVYFAFSRCRTHI